MKQSALHPVLLLLVFLLASSSAIVLAQDEIPLVNAGFEEPYTTSGDDPPREVANGWSRWHVAGSADAGSYLNSEPEYYRVAPDSNRVRSGSSAQLVLSFYASHVGGVYQTVSGITPGSVVSFSVFAHVWSSRYDEVDMSEEDGDVTVSVGIDPVGGTDGESSAIIWSDPVEQYDAFNEYTVETVAQADTITVFVRTTAAIPVKHNNIYLDDASLTLIELPDSTGDAPTAIAEATDASPEATEESALPPTADAAEPTVVADSGTTETPDAGGAGTAEPLPTETLVIPTLEATETEATQPLPAATETSISPTETIEAVPAATETSVSPTETVEAVPDEPATAEPSPVPPTATAISTSTPTPITPTSSPTPLPPVPTSTLVPTMIPTTDLSAFPFTITYSVQRGDTVARLAERYGSTIEVIRQSNDLDSNYLIFVGQQLIIPASVNPDSGQAVVTATPAAGTPVVSGNIIIYTVLEGDSLSRIARLYNTSVAAIAQFNGIVSTSRLQVGQQLRIPRSGVAAPIAPLRTYTVQPGDTLYRISLQFGVTIRRIAEANNIANLNRIYTGQRLIIP